MPSGSACGVPSGRTAPRSSRSGRWRRIWSSDVDEVFVAERPDGGLCGFLEAAIRSRANGCDSTPVGYIEGWYVDEDVRRQGVGRALVEAAEAWARSKGCRQMASDAELWNARQPPGPRGDRLRGDGPARALQEGPGMMERTCTDAGTSSPTTARPGTARSSGATAGRCRSAPRRSPEPAGATGGSCSDPHQGPSPPTGSRRWRGSTCSAWRAGAASRGRSSPPPGPTSPSSTTAPGNLPRTGSSPTGRGWPSRPSWATWPTCRCSPTPGST